MNKRKFKNFNLFTIKYPLTAITSIFHRMSGIFVYLLIPFLLWLLDEAVGSEAGFSGIHDLLSMQIIKFVLWVFLVAIIYHLIAGIRHILMDIGWGEELETARITAMITMVATIICAIMTGIWLW